MPVKKLADECLKDFLDVGLTQTQIAKACDITRQAVHHRINYTKTPQRAKRLRRHFSVIFLRRLGFTIPEIMEYTGYCNGNIRKLLHQHGFLPTDSIYRTKHTAWKYVKIRHFQIEFLLRIGFDLATISEYTGYAFRTVRQYLYMKHYSLKGQAL
jgi:hypothetical protein